MLFSIVVGPLYIHTSNAQGFQVLHLFNKTYFLAVDNSYSNSAIILHFCKTNVLESNTCFCF
jgi:hypothetical protein